MASRTDFQPSVTPVSSRGFLRLVSELEAIEPPTHVIECAELGDEDSCLSVEIALMAQLEILHAPENQVTWAETTVSEFVRHRLQFARRQLLRSVYAVPYTPTGWTDILRIRQDISSTKLALVEKALSR